MVPAKHVVALQQASEATAIGPRPFMDRPIFAWMALSGALAGCAISYAIFQEHSSELAQDKPRVEEALSAVLPRISR